MPEKVISEIEARAKEVVDLARHLAEEIGDKCFDVSLDEHHNHTAIKDAREKFVRLAADIMRAAPRSEPLYICTKTGNVVSANPPPVDLGSPPDLNRVITGDPNAKEPRKPEPLIAWARKHGRLALFSHKEGGINIYEICKKNGKVIHYVASHGEERAVGASPEAAIAALPFGEIADAQSESARAEYDGRIWLVDDDLDYLVNLLTENVKSLNDVDAVGVEKVEALRKRLADEQDKRLTTSRLSQNDGGKTYADIAGQAAQVKDDKNMGREQTPPSPFITFRDKQGRERTTVERRCPGEDPRGKGKDKRQEPHTGSITKVQFKTWVPTYPCWGKRKEVEEFTSRQDAEVFLPLLMNGEWDRDHNSGYTERRVVWRAYTPKMWDIPDRRKKDRRKKDRRKA